MRSLIVIDKHQIGEHPALPEVVEQFKRLGSSHVEVHSPALDVSWSPSDEDVDVLILMDSLGWYERNRMIVPGRPWVCLTAFHMDTLLPIVRGYSTAFDLGLRAVFSCSANFVTQMSAILPTFFTWEPVSEETFEVDPEFRNVKFGCVLPNILDRDFSQLIYTYKYLDECGRTSDMKIFRVEGDERLPEPLNEVEVIKTPAAVEGMFRQIQYYVPAPRITDYRATIIPSDILRAAVCGAFPLVIHHPIMESLLGTAIPMNRSLSRYKVTLESALEQVPKRVTLPSNLRPSPRKFVDQILEVRHRDLGND